MGYEEYPTATPVAAEGEERIRQVALIADEGCRTWTFEWKGRKTFEGSDRLAHRTDNPSRFHLEEIRPLNEAYALARVRHLIGHPSANVLRNYLKTGTCTQSVIPVKAGIQTPLGFRRTFG